MSKDSRRRDWWRSLSSDDQRIWFKKQRVIKEKGGRVRFGETEMREKEETAAVDSNNMVWDHVPWSEYLKEQYALKRTYEEAVASWNSDLMDDDIPKDKAGDAVLVGIFRGKRAKFGIENRNSSIVERKRTIASAEDFEAVAEGSRSHVIDSAQKRSSAFAPVDVMAPDEQVAPDMISHTGLSVERSRLVEEAGKDWKEKRKVEMLLDAADAEDQVAIDEHHAEKRASVVKLVSKNLTEFKTSLVNTCTARILRVQNNLKVATGQIETQKEELRKLTGDKDAEEGKADTKRWQELMSSLDTSLAEAKAEVERVVQQVSIEHIKKLTTVDQLAEFRDKCKKAEGDLNNVRDGGKLGEVKRLVRQVGKTIEAHRKQEEELVAKSAAVAAEAAEPKVTLSKSLIAFAAHVASVKSHLGVGPDAFKGGSVVKLLPKKQVALQIGGTSGWQGHSKWVLAKMEKERRSSTLADMPNAPWARQKMRAHVQSSFDIEFQALKFDEAVDGIENVFQVQSWHTSAESISCGAAPWGMKQALLLVSGSEAVAGLRWDGIVGEGPKQKRQYILDADLNTLKGMFAGGTGFFTNLLPGELLLIPDGYCVLQVTRAEASAGIRWSIPPTTADEGVSIANIMELMMSDFPALATSSHQRWTAALKKTWTVVKM